MNSSRSTLSQRETLLTSLLSLDRNLTYIVRELNRMGWDSEEETVILDRQHIVSILDRYLNRQLSTCEVEAWANAIECREDIGYETGFETEIEEAIQELANPVLTHFLCDRLARQWIQQLTRPNELK